MGSTVLAAGTVGGAGTTVALRAALEALAADRRQLEVIAPGPLVAMVERVAPHALVTGVGRVRAVFGELVGRGRAQVYIGFADRLPLLGRGGVEQVLVVQNPHLYEKTEQTNRLLARCRLALLRWWARRSAVTADRIVCSSTASASAVAASCGIEPTRIEVRPIPVGEPEEVKSTHRDRIERVLLVGDVYGYKRWADAVDAIASFARSVQRPVTVVHVGTDRDASASDLFSAAIVNAAPAHVVVDRRGALAHAEVLTEMRNADVVLLTSTAETQGLPLAEALSVGVPVVCRDIAVFVEQGEGAAVFVTGGSAEFASALLDLDDPDERARRGERGRAVMAAKRSGEPGWHLLD